MSYNLYLITDENALNGKDLVSSIEASIKGGATMVQLREKNISSKDYIELAQKVKEITDHYDIPFIINDRVDIALAVNASGVHLGVDDMPIMMARNLIGSTKLIGASACTVEEAAKLEAEGADYLGVGALFPTSTKDNVDKVTIPELIDIVKSVNIPVVAIGGINESNAHLLKDTRIAGTAIASGILGKEDVLQATRDLLSIVSIL